MAAGFHLSAFSENRNRDKVTDFGESIRQELATASAVKDGYQRQYIIPNMIDGTINYTLFMNNSGIFISSDPYTYSAIIPNTTGYLKKGINTIYKINNTIIIKNE
jgi:hypothetical protein